MKNLRLSITIISISFVQLCFSQGEANNWYFGFQAGITFNNGVPTALTDGAMNTSEGCSVISDSFGNLLFYSNGSEIWDRSHSPMQNSNGLLGSSSSTQNGIIVPHPGDSNLYFIFTLDQMAQPDGLRYHIVDMSLNNGLGAVNSFKNILLHTPSLEKMTAVAHANGNDIWLIAHKYASNEFVSYLIDDNGINSFPVTSAVGFVPSTTGSTVGSMKVSPDGSKIAIIYSWDNIIEVLDFDSNTGIISNPVQIANLYVTVPDGQEIAYGLEFSPNSRYLYFSSFIGGIFQYDLINFTTFSIAASKIELSYDPPTSPIETEEHCALQLGPDGKIYVAHTGHNFLGVINKPNEAGVAADYQFDGVFLGSGRSIWGLPQFVSSFFFSSILVENICLGENTSFILNFNDTIDSISWDFGDGSSSNLENPTHMYSSVGTYMVQVTFTSNGEVYTNDKEIRIFEQPTVFAPQDVSICDIDGSGIYEFDLTQLNNTVLNGQPSSIFDVVYYENITDYNERIAIPEPSNYTGILDSGIQNIVVSVEHREAQECDAVTDFNITVNESPALSMQEQWVLCEGVPLELVADFGYDNYQWSTGETSQSIEVNSIGIYTIAVSNDYGMVQCETVREIEVVQFPEPVITNIEINDWTLNENHITIYVEGNQRYEYSIDGLNYQDSNRFENLESGDYTVFVRSLDGCSEIQRVISLLFYPRFFTPNNDGFNDHWQLYHSFLEPENKIYIFDRYGKLMKQISPEGPGWDGTFNGNPVPSSDYWFRVERSNGAVYNGHFTLKR
ncbi:gliding motility-associated-like protein [Nonlabens dokdonensis]|uniref:Secreted protein containing PKD domain n=2 Tax=Nonlabens dokdonensis TaxID=328515 RepID=L7WDD9_NONDD|nr:T9SS type B sorting domain-containing protein [Nonlabens dokdonensis]AGC76893.1 secreted protein containing PKD domain [Nonlabens dokdonensis DSW-6]PZX36802.1 gliding motility-associated-like protein [Nonlabens dokdonensis]